MIPHYIQWDHPDCFACIFMDNFIDLSLKKVKFVIRIYIIIVLMKTSVGPNQLASSEAMTTKNFERNT